MFGHRGQLEIPPNAKVAKDATEIARIWAAAGKQEVALRTDIWKDPAAWGLMLVDLAKHVANAYEQTEGRDRAEVLARIKAGFDAEWSSATDEPTGAAN
jgi:hypothetical protein